MALPDNPPGWFPDAWGGGELRWWDGTAWTGHTSPRWRKPQGGTPWLVIGLSVLGFLLLTGAGIGALVAAEDGKSSGNDDSSVTAAFDPSDPPPVATTPDPADTYVPPGTRKKPRVSLGTPVSLEDQNGARVRFTVESAGVVHPPRGAFLDPPPKTKRVYAVRVRFTAEGSRVYDDSIYNGLAVMVAGRPHRPLNDDYPACPDSPVVQRLAPGSSRSACFLFTLPRSPDPTRIRYWPSSENSPDVASWRLP